MDPQDRRPRSSTAATIGMSFAGFLVVPVSRRGSPGSTVITAERRPS